MKVTSEHKWPAVLHKSPRGWKAPYSQMLHWFFKRVPHSHNIMCICGHFAKYSGWGTHLNSSSTSSLHPFSVFSAYWWGDVQTKRELWPCLARLQRPPPESTNVCFASAVVLLLRGCSASAWHFDKSIAAAPYYGRTAILQSARNQRSEGRGVGESKRTGNSVWTAGLYFVHLFN